MLLGPLSETHPTGAVHVVRGATPAPGGAALLGVGLLVAARRRRSGR